MNTKINLRVEEYYSVASFLKASFVADRVALLTRFSKFTPEFEKDFEKKIETVRSLESAINLTINQKNATAELYATTYSLNNELNFLSFQFAEAKLDTSLITKVKKELMKRNIEGAGLKIQDIIQVAKTNRALLEQQGMAKNFIEELQEKKAFMEDKNTQQDVVKNEIKILYEKNRGVYNDLYECIATISKAGKIMYKNNVKASQYTISKIVGRMRSGVKSVSDKSSPLTAVKP